MDENYMEEIAGLSPSDKERWSILQARRQALYEPFARVQADIEVGEIQEREAKIEDGQKVESKGGIL